MDFKKINEVLNHDQTIYTKSNGMNVAINTELGCYVSETSGVYSVSDLKNNDLTNIGQEPIKILGMQEVGDILGKSRHGVRWALENEHYDVVPKPAFVNHQKRGNTYFWLESQFDKKG
ncbi:MULTISPECIES: hypothetical protein [Staphylococcaceae]|jgi:hypothetical protein|uniref:Uncharacterized protein n=3 Tax=Mammaliicoccus TaxID=2803850 RepID=A0AB37HNL8_MAMSC|nr:MULTISPECIES: hypothetical protein [Staphylococcaceae]ARB41289.1 hypothetical protein B5728_12105 [Mammaliicoccus sciuri]MBG9206899.1 hypothetical protein [Mammaliicoccus sciuri]MCD8898477.1 hypothetical protein [Mammaliicoccus sciuri]MCE5039724.1 hypothetical protein [Mammaliicoccus sciuri]MCE5058294.1 hypothetical protein [Mammaliicoccus sciuri]